MSYVAGKSNLPRLPEFDEFRRGAINNIFMPWKGVAPNRDRYGAVLVDGVQVRVCLTVEPQDPSSRDFIWHASASLQKAKPEHPDDNAMLLAHLKPAQIKTLCKGCIMIMAGVGSDDYEVDTTRLGKAVHMRKRVVQSDWVNFSE